MWFRAAHRLTEAGVMLETARKGLGISQNEAARRAGLSSQTWTNTILGGTVTNVGQHRYVRPHRPGDDTIAAAARAVGLNPERVLRLDRSAPAPEVPRSVTEHLASVPTAALLAEVFRRSA